ncbi:hypothetical protein [Lactobacillus helveticus]
MNRRGQSSARYIMFEMIRSMLEIKHALIITLWITTIS